MRRWFEIITDPGDHPELSRDNILIKKEGSEFVAEEGEEIPIKWKTFDEEENEIRIYDVKKAGLGCVEFEDEEDYEERIEEVIQNEVKQRAIEFGYIEEGKYE